MAILLALLLCLFAVPSWATTLNWTNHGPYTSVFVERAPTVAGPFTRIATVGGTIQTHVDAAGVAGNCYRVQGATTGPPTAFSNIVCKLGVVGAMPALTLSSATMPDSLPGLILAMGLNAGAGTTAADSSGLNNTGTLTNGPTWTTAGKYGKALSFDGVNDSVAITLQAPLNKTLELWINPQATPIDFMTLLEFGTDAPWLGLRPTRAVEVYNNNPSTAAIPLNSWSHVAYTSDQTTNVSRLYLNGVLAASGTANVLRGTPLGIGWNGSDIAFRGLIDEVRVYNKALTQVQIQADMNTAITP